MFMKMTVEEFLLYLRNYNVITYSCYRQKRFIITIDKKDEYSNVECCVSNSDEYNRLNRALRRMSS